MQKDAELFLGWAADEFVAAGRASEPEQRLHHRRTAELFCDIFRELSRSNELRPPAKNAQDIGKLLDMAFSPNGDGRRRS